MSEDNDTIATPFDLSPEPRMDTSFLHDEYVPPKAFVPTKVTEYSKGDVFRQINSQLVLNEFGIPDFIYRSDIIPATLYDMSPVDRNQVLESAVIPISWDFGYPAATYTDGGALNNVSPIWEQLPGEPAEAFNAFMQYLELPQNSDGNNPVRMLPLLAQALSLSYNQLKDYSHIYYWTVRFRAYDLFLIACHQKQKEQRIMSIEGRHYSMADKYLKKLDIVIGKRLDHTLSELEDSDSSVHDDLKLKDLVDMVEKLTRIQRVAVGLPANGEDKSDDARVGRRNQTIDDSYKEIAAHASPSKKADQRPADMDRLLSNPDDLAAAQDLITKNLRG